MRQEAILWANSRINKGNNYDNQDAKIVVDYIFYTRNIRVDINEVVQSMHKKSIKLNEIYKNMYEHMAEKFTFAELRDQNNLIIKIL